VSFTIRRNAFLKISKAPLPALVAGRQRLEVSCA
jgi:DNA-binding transcriptional LysR family regulator